VREGEALEGAANRLVDDLPIRANRAEALVLAAAVALSRVALGDGDGPLERRDDRGDGDLAGRPGEDVAAFRRALRSASGARSRNRSFWSFGTSRSPGSDYIEPN